LHTFCYFRHVKRLVSILIPAKNEAAFIEDLLCSIQVQTHQYWEAIIVDDHSTDQTCSLVESFSKTDPRIKCLKNQGKGIIHALRTAFIYAEGNWITRMDADDLMKPRKLEVLLECLSIGGSNAVAVGGVQYFSEEGVKSGYKNYEQWLNNLTQKGTNFKEIFRECVIPSPSWMLHRKTLENIGGFQSDRYPEDYDLAFRMWLYDLDVVPNAEIVHEWRDHPARTSRTSEVYKDYTFTDLKWFYFSNFCRNNERELVVLGTGFRGKKLAAHLIERKVHFRWISHNEKKIGKDIYNQKIEPLNGVDWKCIQLIATVGNEKGRRQVNQMAENAGLVLLEDLFHFA